MQAPLQRMVHGLHPFVAHFVVPVFALANAGVDLRHGLGEVLSHPAARGVLVGLVIGKPLGVLAASALAMRLFGATFPDGATWRHLAGAAFLAGIGFTMSLFIDGLAFASATQPFRAAKAAVLAASGVSAAIGFALLFGAARGAARDPPG
ncbi:MAG: Na+/H+ antiporter NhaA [Planctomycetes bacterium]|nr:Na+/H+ antiporter NhaA [Planctomycetota bacterium]